MVETPAGRGQRFATGSPLTASPAGVRKHCFWRSKAGVRGDRDLTPSDPAFPWVGAVQYARQAGRGQSTRGVAGWATPQGWERATACARGKGHPSRPKPENDTSGDKCLPKPFETKSGFKRSASFAQLDLDPRSGTAPQQRSGFSSVPNSFSIRVPQPPISHHEAGLVEADSRRGD